jgi:hypothetical protein
MRRSPVLNTVLLSSEDRSADPEVGDHFDLRPLLVQVKGRP